MSAESLEGKGVRKVVDRKPWYASKTIWVNVVAFAGSLGVMSGYDFGLTVDVQAEIVAAIMGGVNIVLRLLTARGIRG